jgi:hypothetical protein
MLKQAAIDTKNKLSGFGDSLKIEAPIQNYLKDTSPRTLVKNIPLQ